MANRKGRFEKAPAIELGTAFNYWTVIGPPITNKNKWGSRTSYLCRCFCKKERTVDRSHLLDGTSKSCGCKPNPGNRRALGIACWNQILNSYKNGARKRAHHWGLSDTLALELIKAPCRYCGVQWSMEFVGKCDAVKHNGIDRVNNSFGYTPDNCVSCCKTCNKYKSDRPLEEFLVWVKNISQHYLGARYPAPEPVNPLGHPSTD